MCIAAFAGFDANSVRKFLYIAEEHKCTNCGREISVNKMWKGKSRGEKGRQACEVCPHGHHPYISGGL